MTADAVASGGEAEIIAPTRRLMRAWAAGDAVAAGAVFADDSEFVAGEGTRSSGRTGITDYLRGQFAGWLGGTRVVAEPVALNRLSDRVAVLHTEGGILLAGESAPAPERLGVQTWVLVREADGWKVAAYQNTRVRHAF